MKSIHYQMVMERIRASHEDYLRNRADEPFRYRGVRLTRFTNFTLSIEGNTAVVRGYGGFFVVRIPSKRLFERDALRRCGF